MTPTEFRSQLLQALRGPTAEFSFQALVRESGISPTEAAGVAQQVFEKYVARLVEDGDYTAAERRKARSLAAMLEIPDADTDATELRVREDRYRTELLIAQSDGVVTDEEEAMLYQMCISLGLPVVNDAMDAGSTPVVTAPSRSQASGAQPYSEDVLRSKLRFESLNTPAGLRWELEQVRDLDKVAEAKATKWAWIGGLSFAAIFPAFLLMLFTIEKIGGWLIILPIACVLFAIASFIVRSRYARMDVEDRRYTTARSVVHHLGHDMADDDLIAVHVDFNHYKAKSNLQGTEGGGFFSSTKSEKYELPWLTMKGRFLDGTRFRLELSQVVKRKEKRKRKYTKVKEAFSDKINLTLQVRPKLTPLLPTAAEIINSKTHRAGIRIRSVTAQDNRLMLQAVTPRLVRTSGRTSTNNDAASRTSNHHHLLSLFLACYDGIGRAKQVARKAS